VARARVGARHRASRNLRAPGRAWGRRNVLRDLNTRLGKKKRCSLMCAHSSQVCRVSAVSAGLLYGVTKSAYLKTFKVHTPCAWHRIAACFPALRCLRAFSLTHNTILQQALPKASHH